ncbi:ribonuclease H-like domain-containing protein [Biscogniauxia mediterranea]|nr:ribonuclease H-like domain-containing protein [Biscogniauxia mediterranea]
MDSSQDFKSIQEKIQKALILVTQSTNKIAAEDLSFQRTSNPTVAEELDDASSRLLTLTSSLLKSASKNTDVNAPSLEDADDVDVHWSRIVDVVDTLLEKADTSLDEYTGAIKRKNAPVEQTSLPINSKSRFSLDHSIRRANILKPQHAFEIKPDNQATSPWKPLLTTKPHAVVPLEQSLETFTDEAQTTQYGPSIYLLSTFQSYLARSAPPLLQQARSREACWQKSKRRKNRRFTSAVWEANYVYSYSHPYEVEISNLEYPESVFHPKEPTMYLPFETTTATFVDTYEGVLQMLEELKGATEIAIDAEHHDFRSYAGLLSLMQISTREKDWIVDTLQPWRHKLQVLNEVFADPKIVKVLHGAYMDIIWLQRDCGLYIVGLFDTFEAASALQYPARSLAYLLKKFVNFDADKKYQLADWRVRPIPEEMFYYARSDTHYLLYIYDMLRNKLLQHSSDDPEQDLMRTVLENSKATSLRKHEAFPYDAETGQGPFGWYNMLIRQSTGKLTKEQFSVFRAVHKWRDEVARREDESPLFVMNNGTLFDIARRMPPDPKALHSLLSSGSSIAKREVSQLFDIIAKAAAEGANGPTVADVIRKQVPSMGVGEIAKTLVPQIRNLDSETDAIETKDLISQTSRLWGNVAMSSRWEQPLVDRTKSVQFELPWAHFVQSAQVVSGPKALDNSSSLPQVIPSENASAALNNGTNGDGIPEDSDFTLKTGLKRKAPEPESSSASEFEAEGPEHTKPEPSADAEMNDEEIAVPDTDQSEEERNTTKKSKKAEKKARKLARRDRKRAKHQAKQANNAGSEQGKAEDDDEEYEPFDYTQAKSVLNAERTAAANGNAGAQQKARFNPYAMTAGGPKPARRMHGEKTGKSATFRN